MTTAQFGPQAEADLDEISRHTLKHWGPAQTRRYLRQIDSCCNLLAEFPSLGRLCEDLWPGLRRFEQGRHVIFYTVNPEGIRVSRILHASMRPDQHLTGEDEQQ